MNIKEVLNSTAAFFTKHNIPEARLDAEVLLADLLGMERISLYVNFDYPLSEDELSLYRERIKKRVQHFPVAYITGHKEFMSLDFSISDRVLVPRPETEQLVEEIISYCRREGLDAPHIVDVGTGSGVIMVSLGYYIKDARILGIDISDEVLQVTAENINRHGLGERLKVIRGDLLAPLIRMGKNNVDIVVSNPPYISSAEMKTLSPEVKKEPELALTSGESGLEIYSRLVPEALKILRPGGLLALEIGYQQAGAVKRMFSADWNNIEVKKDYAGHDRMVFAVKK